MTERKHPRWGLRILAALGVVLVACGIALAVAVHHRQEQEQKDSLYIPQSSMGLRYFFVRHFLPLFIITLFRMTIFVMRVHLLSCRCFFYLSENVVL